LIEVLVVVAIIALLVAILIPSLASARRQAQAITCSTNLRTSGAGVNYYAQVDRGYYPGGGWWAEVSRVYVQSLSAGKKFVGPEETWDGKGVDQTVEFYSCPGDVIRHRTWNVPQKVGEEWVRTNYRISYSFNAFLSNRPSDLTAMREKNNFALSGNRRKLSQVKRPSTVVMLTDGGNDGIHRYWEIQWDFDDAPDEGDATLEVHHKDGNNFLYADLHGEYKKVLSREPPAGSSVEDYMRSTRRQGIPIFPWNWVPVSGLKGQVEP